MSDFKVGDRVRYTSALTRRMSGKVGIVVEPPFAGSGMVYFDHGGAEPFGAYPNSLALVEAATTKQVDMVNNPPHYTAHPSGVECIEITRHMGFNVGNAVKYLWRADLKGAAIQDLEKAAFYIQDEITKRKAASA